MSAVEKLDFGLSSGTSGGVADEAETLSVPGADTSAAELDSEALRAVSEEISRDFAPQLEHTALVLYDRDPAHLQAQWYVTPEELAQARSAFPGGGAGVRQVLRLCRLDQDGKSEVVASAYQRTGEFKGEGLEGFPLPGDGFEYECELGLESDSGGWLLLARSNRIRLSDRTLPLPAFGFVPSDSQGQYVPGGPNRHEDLEDIPVEAALAALSKPLYPVFPNLEPEETPAARRPVHAEEIFGRAKVQERKPEFAIGAVQQPVESLRPSAREAAMTDLETMPPPLLPSSLESGNLPGLPGAFYDPRAALSSAALRRVQPPAFDMEIEAELIVQGRARPGSTIELFGHSVPVGDDGRFCIRRPLEDPMLLSLVKVRGPGPGREDPESE